MKKLVFFLSPLLFASSPLDIINSYRTNTGLNPLKENSHLQCAATKHNEYMAKNRIYGHYEMPNTPYFIGKTPGDRAINCGYESRYISENISHGQDSYKESIENLMGAIYHRINFLDFDIDEIGYSKNNQFFTYDMGNSYINTACQKEWNIRSGSYGVCKEFNKIIPTSYINQLQSKNPKLIFFPYNNMKNVPTTFYNENPDPLPDYDVSGYPISIHLNPYYFKTLMIKSFEIYQNNKKIENTRILTYKNDPNKQLHKTDAVLFPLTPLKPNTTYHIEAKILADNKPINLSWDFTTKTIKSNYLINDAKYQEFTIKPNKDYIIYLKPLSAHDTFNSIKVKYIGVLINKFKLKDNNHILVNLKGNGSFKIFAKDREIELKVKE
jgi:hypothetical protein